MKKVIKLESSKMYLIRSSACVNSCYFENENEVQLFWKLFNVHLRNYVKIIDSCITKDGFQMVIKVNKTSKILNQYIRFKKFKNKTYEYDGKDIWRIISEKFRVFLGQYVPAVNKLRGSKGVLVRNKYERFQFEGRNEAIEYCRKTRKGQVNLEQDSEKYQSKRGHSKIKWIVTEFRNMAYFIDIEGVRSALVAKWISYSTQRPFHQKKPLR